jgi:hypothetical protein
MKKHSKTKIRVVKLDYKVSNKVTVCTMIADPQIDFNILALLYHNRILKPIIQKYFILGDDDTYYLHITQKTRCHDTDEFNVITGQRIAESKCKAKAFDIMNKVYSMFYIHNNFFNDSILALASNCAYALGTELNHIQELQK